MRHLLTHLEVIPKTCRELWLDPIDSLIALRKAHTQEDGWKFGINVNDGTACDMIEANVVEPKRVAAQAIRSAADIASQLIRIEKIITAKRRRRLETMTSSSEKVEAALSALLESGRTFILMVQTDSGNLTYYTNNSGDQLFVVEKKNRRNKICQLHHPIAHCLT